MSIVALNRLAQNQKFINNIKQKKSSISGEKIPKNWGDFASHLTIQSGDKFVRYIPYDYQIQLDKTFESHHTTIGVKSRQMGWTTYSASKGLHKALLNPAYTAIYVSRTQSDASLIAYTVRQMLLSIPEYASAENDNLLILRIKGGGTLHFRSPGENATRGIPSVSDIFIDESAFIENVELLYGQIKNTQSMVQNSKTLIISTPNTTVDWFYEKLTNGTSEILDLINQVRRGEKEPIQILEDEKSGWAKFICHWKAHPIYSQIPDYLQQCAEKEQIPLEMVYRERDLSFEDNTFNVFNYQLIRECFCLEKYDRFDSPIDDNASYYLGIDTAGRGDDYFVCIVLKKVWENIELVYMYRKQNNEIQVNCDEVGRLIDKYKPRQVAIENNGGGQSYVELLHSHFPSIKIEGINTNVSTKPAMINKLKYLIESKRFKAVDDGIVRKEFLGFQQTDDGKFSAPSGRHDDCVMAVAIGCYPMLTD